MRTAAFLAFALWPVLVASAQERQPFRGGVELITIEVAVLDRSGRPVEDLRPPDFTVSIDGQPREVVAAEFVRFPTASGTGVSAGAAAGARADAGQAATAGRRIMIAVDQQFIAPGAIASLLAAAGRFVDGLTPGDQIAFTAFPAPAPHVDFTMDRTRVRQAMQGVRIGQAQRLSADGHDITLSEAIAIADREASVLGPGAIVPPTVRRVMERSCRGVATDAARDRAQNPTQVDGRSQTERDSDQRLLASETDDCRRRVRDDAVRIAREARSDGEISLRELEALLRQLAAIQGPKSLLLVSGGLLLEDQARFEEVARLAAAARTSINVLAVDRPETDPVTVNAVPTDQAPTTMRDRQLHMEGLREVAAGSRGSVFFVAGTGDGIFDRIATELSAHYILAIETRAADRESRRQRVAVDVRRAGLTVRSARPFVPASAPSAVPPVAPAGRVATGPLEAAVTAALASPTPLATLPLQAATFAQRDPVTGRTRLNIVAAVTAGSAPGDVALAYQLTNSSNRVVATSTKPERLTHAPSAMHYGSAVVLDPGTYSLRVAAADAGGRGGSVVQTVTVPPLPAGTEIAAGDLMIGMPPKPGEPLRPQVEPGISGGTLVAYVELYGGPEADLEWASVALEVAPNAGGEPLVSEQADIADGPRPTWRIATAQVPTGTLSPGRYVVRARLTSVDAVGRDVMRELTPRWFVLEP